MNLRVFQQEFRALGNADIAAHSQRFFKTGKGEYGEGDVFLGLRVPVIRAEVKRCRGQMSLEQVIKILHSKYHEERLFAVLMLVDLYQRGDEAQKQQVYQTYLANTGKVNNWDLVDASAHKIVGPHLGKSGSRLLPKLAKSSSLWERRIAIMTTCHFIVNHDFADTVKLSERLLNDPEDLMHKATGWMLREVGNRDKSVLEAFLKEHVKDMPRTMLRYSIEKFPEEERKAWLRA